MVWLQAALVASVLSGTGETVLLDFYADWCGPCRAMGPAVDALVAEGYPVRKIDIDRDPQLAREYGVGSIPFYVMLVDGRVVDRVVGGTSYSRLKRACELGRARGTPRESSPVIAQIGTGGTRSPIAIPAVHSVPPLETAPRQPSQIATPPDLPDPQPSRPGWTPRRGAEATLDAALIAASVRLRIEDENGHSCGSGTIIDARQGEALILTCGHIFRDSGGKGRIEVDLFGPGGLQKVAGDLISFDLKRDVGLLSIRTPGPVAVARVAPPGYRIAPGDAVVSVGCNNGDRPTAQRSRVNSLDKFLGPPNLQVAGMPVEGRSGGGLFSAEGLVIGVCNAADPSDKEGLYAALTSIHGELDRAELAHIANSDGQGSAPLPAASAAASEIAVADPPPLAKRMPRVPAPAPAEELPLRETATTAGDAAPLSLEEQAALEEIRRRLREGAEVICVVRSRRDPAAKSEVIILDKVSPNFLKQLAAEARPQAPLPTSLEIPRKRPPAAGVFGGGSPPQPAKTAPVRRRLLEGNWTDSTGGWRASGLDIGSVR